MRHLAGIEHHSSACGSMSGRRQAEPTMRRVREPGRKESRLWPLPVRERGTKSGALRRTPIFLAAPTRIEKPEDGLHDRPSATAASGQRLKASLNTTPAPSSNRFVNQSLDKTRGIQAEMQRPAVVHRNFAGIVYNPPEALGRRHEGGSRAIHH